jgi:uncharacterized protein (DUF433 family)
MARGKTKSRQISKPVSFRFSEETVSSLRDLAGRRPESQTDLAERYIVEGMRQEEHPLIRFRDGAGGRRPSILGTRLDVADIVTAIRENEASVPETAEVLGIPVEQVEAAARYYADYKGEVDVWIQEGIELADREHERWVRQQEAFA